MSQCEACFRTILEQRAGLNNSSSRALDLAFRFSDGQVQGFQKFLVDSRQALAQASFRLPTEGGQPGSIDQLAWTTVWLTGIELQSTPEPHHSSYQSGEFFNRLILTTYNICRCYLDGLGRILEALGG
jgi:hypothetical protein